MPFTTPPPAPNRNNPSTFSAYMDAFLAWLVVFWQELNNSLQLFSTKGYATFQGGSTANALVLSAGYPPGSIEIGTKIRFRATQPNTGSATINLDGTGARQCRTVTGAVLPAGYIRTDVETEATYDGTRWVLDRQDELISAGANGFAERRANGVQLCYNRRYSVADAPLIVSFAAVFRDDVIFPQATCTFDQPRYATCTALSPTGMNIHTYNGAGGENVSPEVSWTVRGRWY